MSEQEQTASLACSEGSSDKVYFAQLTAKGDGWIVTAQSGPRGGTMKNRDKITTPVAYAVAEKAFLMLVKEKLAKRYLPSESQGETRMTAAPTVPAFTDVRIQLLNEIDASDVPAYLSDNAYVIELKHDGERRPLVLDGNDIYGTNKKGQRVALLETIANAAAELPVGREGRTVIDGEQVGDTLFVWDLLECEGRDLRSLSGRDRNARLRTLFEGFLPGCPIVVTERAEGFSAKTALLDRVIAEGLEGVAFKRAAAPFTAGRPASGGDWFKYKLKASATVRVKAHNTGKASIAVEMKDGANWVGVGNVTIPANYTMPAVGKLAEIEYLYVSNVGGSLFQPVYKGERFDQDESDCDIGQLKYKGVAQAA